MMRTSSPKRVRTEATGAADRLHSAAIRLLRFARVADIRSGIGPARLSALSVLVYAGPLSLKRLAQIEQVRQPTMSRIAVGLERLGLVRRTPSPKDRRAILLRPTALGLRTLEAARRRRIAILAEKMESFSGAELVVLAAAAGLVLERLQR